MKKQLLSLALSMTFIIAATLSASAQMSQENSSFYGFETYATSSKAPMAKVVVASSEGIKAVQGQKVLKIDATSTPKQPVLWAKIAKGSKAALVPFKSQKYTLSMQVYVKALPNGGNIALQTFFQDKKSTRVMYKLANVTPGQWTKVEGVLNATSIAEGETLSKTFSIIPLLKEGAIVYLDDIQLTPIAQ